MQIFAVATSVVQVSDLTNLVTSISENLVANLPFILAVVGFGIVLKLVISHISDPFGNKAFDKDVRDNYN